MVLEFLLLNEPGIEGVARFMTSSWLLVIGLFIGRRGPLGELGYLSASKI